jgi:hypothetical protein
VLGRFAVGLTTDDEVIESIHRRSLTNTEGGYRPSALRPLFRRCLFGSPAA